ncbi:hypothetical protein IT411_01655 [Candidatus Peregrinibacteria bacterium]|nr:hypothetical protein [Candidatus Peregrinibacteria bacterium]
MRKSSRKSAWHQLPEKPRDSGVNLVDEVNDDLFEQQQEAIESTVERQIAEMLKVEHGQNDNALKGLKTAEEILPMDMGMAMDIVAMPKLSLWQKFRNWVRKVEVTPQYLACRQRSAQVRRKLEGMRREALKEVKNGLVQKVEAGYKTYLDTWSFLEKYEGDQNWPSRLLVIWEEFLVYLKQHEELAGLNKFADRELIAQVLKRFPKQKSLVVECLRWVLGNSRTKIELLINSPAIEALPKELVPLVFSQFVVHPVQVVEKTLKLMEELPAGYIDNHNRSFRLIVFCSTTKNPTVEELMDFISGREDEDAAAAE